MFVRQQETILQNHHIPTRRKSGTLKTVVILARPGILTRGFVSIRLEAVLKADIDVVRQLA
jgi:hypothetical protein